MTTPAGWQTVHIDNAGAFAVPGEARVQQLQPIDSIVGQWIGDGYEVIYDFGRAGEDLDELRGKPGFRKAKRAFDGRPGVEVSHRGEAGARWGAVRIMQVKAGANTLTIRVSCADTEICGMADVVFDSVRLTGR